MFEFGVSLHYGLEPGLVASAESESSVVVAWFRSNINSQCEAVSNPNPNAPSDLLTFCRFATEQKDAFVWLGTQVLSNERDKDTKKKKPLVS